MLASQFSSEIFERRKKFLAQLSQSVIGGTDSRSHLLRLMAPCHEQNLFYPLHAVGVWCVLHTVFETVAVG